MLPYIYLYGLLFVFTILSFTVCSNAKNKPLQLAIKRNNNVFYVCSVLIWLFIATRDVSVGTDTKYYVDFFKHPNFWYLGEPSDFLFEQIGRFLHLFGKSPRYFIFTISTLYLVGLFFLINKLSVNKPLSVFLFCIVGIGSIFFFDYLCIIRQAMALSFYFIAIYLYFERSDNAKKNTRNKWWGIILYVCAYLTHGTCLIALPILILVDKVHISNKGWIVLIILTYIIAALKLFSVGDFLEVVFSFLGDDGHYAGYADVNFGFIEDKGWFNMFLLPYSIIAILLLIMPKKEEINKWYVQLFFYSAILNNLFSDNLMWSRLIVYFSIFFIIAIPNVLNQQKWHWKVICYSIIFIYFSYKTFSILISDASVYATGNIIIPYKSWLFFLF
jgi:hypothetical protein